MAENVWRSFVSAVSAVVRGSAASSSDAASTWATAVAPVVQLAGVSLTAKALENTLSPGDLLLKGVWFLLPPSEQEAALLDANQEVPEIKVAEFSAPVLAQLRSHALYAALTAAAAAVALVLAWNLVLPATWQSVKRLVTPSHTVFMFVQLLVAILLCLDQYKTGDRYYLYSSIAALFGVVVGVLISDPRAESALFYFHLAEGFDAELARFNAALQARAELLAPALAALDLRAWLGYKAALCIFLAVVAAFVFLTYVSASHWVEFHVALRVRDDIPWRARVATALSVAAPPLALALQCRAVVAALEAAVGLDAAAWLLLARAIVFVYAASRIYFARVLVQSQQVATALFAKLLLTTAQPHRGHRLRVHLSDSLHLTLELVMEALAQPLALLMLLFTHTYFAAPTLFVVLLVTYLIEMAGWLSHSRYSPTALLSRALSTAEPPPQRRAAPDVKTRKERLRQGKRGLLW